MVWPHFPLRDREQTYHDCVSHEIRGVIELRARDQRIERVASTPGLALVVEDWHMKVLNLPFREVEHLQGFEWLESCTLTST